MTRQVMVRRAASRYELILDAAVSLGGWQFIKPRDRWSLYLMASYCYYELDRGLMPDALFDSLCGTLLAGGLGEDWWFKDLWDESALAAGSGYHTFVTSTRRCKVSRWLSGQLNRERKHDTANQDYRRSSRA